VRRRDPEGEPQQVRVRLRPRRHQARPLPVLVGVYPTDYGFIPDTLAQDGDELDALICVSEPTFPGCIVLCRAIGLFEMEDEHGIDAKVLCVPCDDPGWTTLEQLDDLPRALRDEIAHFFAIYKDLDSGRESNVKGWRDRDAALREIDLARERFASRRKPA
jgi:inorganic pyrophosphatase